MKKTPALLASLLLSCILPFGCVQLKEVHTFTESSQAALDKDTLSHYGYADYCWDSSYIFNRKGRELVDFDCDCSGDRLSDTLLGKEYKIMGAWFDALGRLAGAASKINFAPLGASIPAGTYGKLTVTSEESSVVNALATAATDLFTEKYKSKKLKEILVIYHDTVSTALELMALHLDNLKGRIGDMQLALQLKCDLLMKKDSTDTGKWAIAYTYKQKYKELSRIMVSYDKRKHTIDKIREGHDTLYKNVDELNSEGVKKEVLGFAYDIIFISNNTNN